MGNGVEGWGMGWRDGEWGEEIGSGVEGWGVGWRNREWVEGWGVGWRDGDLICYSFLCSYVHMATYILHCSNK